MRRDKSTSVVFLQISLGALLLGLFIVAPLSRKLLSSKGKPLPFLRVARPAESGACGPKPLFLFSKSIFREIPPLSCSTWTAEEGGRLQTTL